MNKFFILALISFFPFSLSASESEAECDGAAVESFRYVFMKNRDSGIWSGGDKEFFYFIGSDKSTVFMTEKGADSRTYKIESNFLSKERIKDIFSSHL